MARSRDTFFRDAGPRRKSFLMRPGMEPRPLAVLVLEVSESVSESESELSDESESDASGSKRWTSFCSVNTRNAWCGYLFQSASLFPISSPSPSVTGRLTSRTWCGSSYS